MYAGVCVSDSAVSQPVVTCVHWVRYERVPLSSDAASTCRAIAATLILILRTYLFVCYIQVVYMCCCTWLGLCLCNLQQSYYAENWCILNWDPICDETSVTVTGSLQLLKMLEIYWNLESLLEMWDTWNILYYIITISCSSKSRLVLTFLVLPFWYLLTRVNPDIFQTSSKTVVCVCVH